MTDITLSHTLSEADSADTQALADYWTELMSIREQIDTEQREIERLKVENRELRAETRAMLSALKATMLR